MRSQTQSALIRSPSWAGEVLHLRAGKVRLRLQPAMPLQAHYAGGSPMLVYLYQAPPRSQHPSGLFGLLKPGPAIEVHVPEPVEALLIAFEGEWDLGPGSAPLRGLADGGMRYLAEEIRRAMLDQRGPDLRYIEALAEVMLRGIVRRQRRQAAQTVAETLPAAKLKRMKAYIDVHLDGPISVTDLAVEAGLSRAHFSRGFRNAVGETPHRYIQQMRLERAKAWIEEGAQDLAAVAARAGFSSHAHFTTAFRKAFGLTPSEHRRQVALKRVA